MTISPLSPPWCRDVQSMLVARAPIPFDELMERTGLQRGELLPFLQRQPYVRETGSGWVDVRHLTDGVAFTHELSPAECEAGVLAADDDLALVAVLAEHGLRLAGSDGDVRAVTLLELPPAARSQLPPGSGLIGVGLIGPDGWLAGFRAGDVLQVEVAGDVLLLRGSEPVQDSTARTAIMIAAVAAALGQEIEQYRAGEAEIPAVDLVALLIELLVEYPEISAGPLPPLGAAFRRHGWETFGGRCGMAGTAWNLSTVEHLDRIDAFAAMAAVGLMVSWDPVQSDGEQTIEAVRQVIAAPETLEYVAGEVERRTALTGTSFTALLEQVRAAAVTAPERAGAALLAARAAEGAGDSERARHLVAQALIDQPDLKPALLDAAEYAACRGDLRAADRCLRRANHPRAEAFHGAVRAVLQAPVPAGGPGRNQPCPCGSGRKYKACCQLSAVPPLQARAQLLYALLATYAQRPVLDERLRQLISQSGRRESTVLLCIDLLLTHEGAVERFLQARGGWLRADERRLIEEWRSISIGTLEVREVRHGVDVTVRGLPDGEPVTLVDRSFSTCVRSLDLLCGRILTNGVRPQILALPVAVTRDDRRALIDLMAGQPSADQIIAFFDPQPDPYLQNSDGHAHFDVEVALEAGADVEAGWQRLASRLIALDHDVLESRGERGGKVVSLGQIRRSGTRWTLHANSLERVADLQAFLHAEEIQVQELSRRVERVGGEPPRNGRRVRTLVLDSFVVTDEVTEELNDRSLARFHSRAWLDAPNSLGMTPREAARAGGAHRIDLDAILDDIEWHQRHAREQGKPAVMDLAWIRAELGFSG